MNEIKKRFPTDTILKEKTFLNDKKIDAELYAFLQELSYPNQQKETIVNKKKMPTQAEICRSLGIKSPKTLRAHLNYLIQAGYVEDRGNEYYLPNKEDIFTLLPLSTTKFLHDCLKDQVVKIYLYLGQRWSYKGSQYIFTIEEIAEHIGINLKGNLRGYEVINNALTCLVNNDLINYVEFYENNKPRKRLTNFSLEYKCKMGKFSK